MRILCYGDSNTWGFNPEDGSRHARNLRWTGVLQSVLGNEYEVLEDGINGRTTVWDNPYTEEYQNGFKGLGYSLNSTKPLDLVILMLGSNDLNYTDAEGIGKGLYRIINRLLDADKVFKDTTRGSSRIWRGEPKILLVSPIQRHLNAKRTYSNGEYLYTESLKTSAVVRKLAEEFSLLFLDAAEYASPSPVDTLHMDAENHQKLGIAIAEAIKEIFK